MQTIIKCLKIQTNGAFKLQLAWEREYISLRESWIHTAYLWCKLNP